MSRPTRTRSLQYATLPVLALLIFGPLAFGAVEDWSSFVLKIGITAVMAAVLLVELYGGDARFKITAAIVPLCAFALIAIVGTFFGSAYRFASIVQLQLYVCYAMFILAGWNLFQREPELKYLAITASVFGAALATFAIIQDFAWNGKIYWLREPRFGGHIFGPYVNHNHFAGIMEMLLPLSLLPTIAGKGRLSTRVLFAAASVVMAVSIVLSRSRGGFAVLILEILLVSVLVARSKHWQTSALMGGIVGFVILLVLLWKSEGLVNRVSTLENPSEAAGTRWLILKDSIAMIKAKPFFGWGVGTFPIVYPAFRTFESAKLINAAHNDYLQSLVETGVFGFAMIMWFMASVLGQVARAANRFERNWKTVVRTGAGIGCIGLLAHSFLDFNLQVPANACWFFFLCGVVIAHDPSEDSEVIYANFR